MKTNNKIDEAELLESIEKGEWKTIDNFESEKIRHQKIAKEFLKKDKRINIRISSRDLELLQIKANEEGLPYQTLISSVLHKYVNKSLNI